MASRGGSPDLGSGNVRLLVLKMAFPTVLGQVVNLLYNIVDRIYIGHIPGIGAQALTGVGLFNPLLLLVTACALLVGAGGAPLAAIEMGKGDNRRAEKIVGNCMTALLLLSGLLTVLYYGFAPQLLRLFGASGQTLPYALPYARIYSLGTVFVMTVLGMNLIVTAQGFSKISMLTTVIGAVINIVLDPIFIFVFHWGVFGAGLATILSQAVGATWVVIFLTGKRANLRIRKENLRLEKEIILPCLGLGVSTFVMMSTESLLFVSFTSSLSRYGGDLAVGAMTILNSLMQLVSLPLAGMTQGAQPVISFNFGARNKQRTKEAFYTSFVCCVAYAGLFWLVMTLFSHAMVGIFTSDPALQTYAAWALRIYMACIFTVGFQNCCQQSFMALGQARISLLLACLRKIILLIPLIFILPHFFADKVFAVLLAEPVSDLLAAAATTFLFMTRFNRILERGPQR